MLSPATARLSVELDGGRQGAEPYEYGDVHRLSLRVVLANQHGNEQDRHHQVLGKGGVDRTPIIFKPIILLFPLPSF